MSWVLRYKKGFEPKFKAFILLNMMILVKATYFPDLRLLSQLVLASSAHELSLVS